MKIVISQYFFKAYKSIIHSVKEKLFICRISIITAYFYKLLIAQNGMKGCLVDGCKSVGRSVYILDGEYRNAKFKHTYKKYKFNPIVKHRLQR